MSNTKIDWRTILVAAASAVAISVTAVKLSATSKDSNKKTAVTAAAPQASAAPTVYVVREVSPKSPTPAEAAPTASVEVAQAPEAPEAPEVDPLQEWDDKFVNDSAPTQRSTMTERQVLSTFTSPNLPGVRVQHVVCRASICKAEVEFKDEETDRETFRKTLLDPENELMRDKGVIIADRAKQPDGTVVATMYFYSSTTAPANTGS